MFMTCDDNKIRLLTPKTSEFSTISGIHQHKAEISAIKCRGDIIISGCIEGYVGVSSIKMGSMVALIGSRETEELNGSINHLEFAGGYFISGSSLDSIDWFDLGKTKKLFNNPLEVYFIFNSGLAHMHSMARKITWTYVQCEHDQGHHLRVWLPQPLERSEQDGGRKYNPRLVGWGAQSSGRLWGWNSEGFRCEKTHLNLNCYNFVVSFLYYLSFSQSEFFCFVLFHFILLFFSSFFLSVIN